MFLLTFQNKIGKEYYYQHCNKTSLWYHIKKLTIIHFVLLINYKLTTWRIGATASVIALLAHNGNDPRPATQNIKQQTAKRSSHVASVNVR